MGTLSAPQPGTDGTKQYCRVRNAYFQAGTECRCSRCGKHRIVSVHEACSGCSSRKEGRPVPSLNWGIPPEPYVDADAIAAHLHIARRRVLQLTRTGNLPAHPLDPEARRKVWRYRISEVDDVIALFH